MLTLRYPLFFHALIFCTCATALAQRTVTVSADYGYDATNSTRFLQEALDDETAGTIVVDRQAGPWVSDGLILRRDDVTIRFEEGTILEAIPGALTNSEGRPESLISVRGARNLRIEGEGGGATIRMNKADYPPTSEFRHCIQLKGVVNGTVENLTLTGAAGDGIFIESEFVVEGSNEDPDVPCRDIELRNLVCDANGRQGCSVSDVVGLLVEDCTFSNTEGTEPEAGIDFEPYRDYQRLQGILVTRSGFVGNHGHGIQFGGVDLGEASPPSDIVIEDCVVDGNGLGGANFRAGIGIKNLSRDGQQSSPGTFTVRGTTISNETTSGIRVQQYATGLDVSFVDVTIENVVTADLPLGVAAILVVPPERPRPNNSCYGSVDFDNVTIVDDGGADRFQVNIQEPAANQSGPRDVTGEICVRLPEEADFRFFESSESCDNFDLAVTECSGPLPVELVGFSGREVACAHELTWTVASASELGGFAIEVRDGDGAAAWRESLTFATAGDLSEGTSFTRAVDGDTDAYYRLRSDFVDGTSAYSDQVFVDGCEDRNETWAPFPNPTAGLVTVGPSERPRTLRVVDGAGRVTEERTLAPGETTVNLRGAVAGLYTFELREGEKRRVARVQVR